MDNALLYDANGLPDPRADLDWSGFKGAIHDIFDKNAQKHPERTCVVETESESSPERRFTYMQINQAANILSNYLVRNGVERGDVVMVYAYRGVDLVVAVMGVLRAGGTFSVIDPAYPPERQKIYLEVAQPRALINIKKATQEAGELSQLVRSYIDTELNLKTEVPSLYIEDNGNLLGGKLYAGDIFDSLRNHANVGPDVLVGPDSNPTLSFTSGSEGRPKGVLGRHFSLTYYFPWMAQRFELSEKDKFTLLSGIAHDPVQRDVFTPLFLGAQLLVPAKEDIQHEQLAIWMKNHEPTVTHLTPAMGQILVGGSSAEFPSLHHAFFVGDVLTKRDCLLLQRLGQNVNIINMFGTTETQRAVSYFEIPSRAKNPNFLDSVKDLIPAGRGMLNVQLIVVNREDKNKRCGIGEPGEIFMRAGGLAECYISGNDLLNREKFVPNWFTERSWQDEYQEAMLGKQTPAWASFYKGPRDRMYRTGDLGQYLPSGDVECLGRVDDQVKIRGFRIELGDINACLSRHKLVRDSVTLVRRDKDEEPTLVSYVVPEFNAWSTWLAQQGIKDVQSDDSIAGMLRRFKPLQNDLREHLKTRFRDYEIPTYFIPLLKLPLNPNGKVDKPALPFPDIANLIAEQDCDPKLWESLSEDERVLASIWAELIPQCHARNIPPMASFFDLGGNSLKAQQVVFKVKRQILGTRPTTTTLFENPTLRGFANSLHRTGPLLNGTAYLNGSAADTNGTAKETRPADDRYSRDARNLATTSLPKRFLPWKPSVKSESPTVLLTGASGYLGAFLLRDLLTRENPEIKVIAHVRAKTDAAALQRLLQTCRAYGVWQDRWTSRLSCVTGNLSQPRLGIDDSTWTRLADVIDIVIHNGAQVHWVHPYSALKPVNVLATIEALQLCSIGRPKRFAFISSTSVLDTEHYVQLSAQLVRQGKRGIPEDDDLEGSSSGLGTGYGQTKWASEYLVRQAGLRGMSGVIVRPGYILGDSISGDRENAVTITDDFLIRMLKGCIQLASRPQIDNTINMTPVDYVARTVVAAAFHPPRDPLGVVQITSHRRLSFNDYLSSLEAYGYEVKETAYTQWRDHLQQYADDMSAKGGEAHALMPLHELVTRDLPNDTRAPELDDTNAQFVLARDEKWTKQSMKGRSNIDESTIGKYLRYLIDTGFLKAPERGASTPRALPPSMLQPGQREVLRSLVGRGALA